MEKELRYRAAGDVERYGIGFDGKYWIEDVSHWEGPAHESLEEAAREAHAFALCESEWDACKPLLIRADKGPAWIEYRSAAAETLAARDGEWVSVDPDGVFIDEYGFSDSFILKTQADGLPQQLDEAFTDVLKLRRGGDEGASLLGRLGWQGAGWYSLKPNESGEACAWLVEDAARFAELMEEHYRRSAEVEVEYLGSHRIPYAPDMDVVWPQREIKAGVAWSYLWPLLGEVGRGPREEILRAVDAFLDGGGDAEKLEAVSDAVEACKDDAMALSLLSAICAAKLSGLRELLELSED